MDRRKIPQELVADVKNYLNITWDDEATDQRIAGLIAYLRDGMHRTLLMEYVRYGRDGALDVFENNYQALLLGMQNDWAVMRYGEAMEESL